jgi:hypothetical protein
MVAEAISAGIFNDLGSGSNVDVCIITKDNTEMLRNYETPVRCLPFRFLDFHLLQLYSDTIFPYVLLISYLPYTLDPSSNASLPHAPSRSISLITATLRSTLRYAPRTLPFLVSAPTCRRMSSPPLELSQLPAVFTLPSQSRIFPRR